MADDLKLEIVIQALLDAKGFEEAKQNLEGLTATANKSTPVIESTGTAVKRTGESFGGTRGPVADLTRLLLQNAGVTGAAGEAAKAAGTAMYFMEGAASAANVAITGGVAAIALLLPLIVQWISGTKQQTKEQEDLSKSLKDALPIIERYAAQAKVIQESARLQIEAQRGRALREEAQELEKLTRDYNILFGAVQRTSSFAPIAQEEVFALKEMRGRMMDLQEAQKQGISVEELYARRIKTESTPAVKEKTRAVEKLTDAQKIAAEQEQDALVDIVTFTQKADKAKRKAIEDESGRLLALQKVKEDQLQIDRQLADEKLALDRLVAESAARGFASLLALFGKNKAAAIAEALISANVAAARALAEIPWPANVAVAAAVYAEGIVRANEIRKTEVGFDDPFADLTARRLGRKSAVDFVANFGAGFHSGMGAAMGGGGTVNHHTTINRGMSVGSLTVPGFMGAGRTEFMKHLRRELIKTDRLERRTTVGR